jgi:hypothetical protein
VTAERPDRHYLLTSEERDTLAERLDDIIDDPDVDEADPDEIATLKAVRESLDWPSCTVTTLKVTTP